MSDEQPGKRHQAGYRQEPGRTASERLAHETDEAATDDAGSKQQQAA